LVGFQEVEMKFVRTSAIAGIFLFFTLAVSSHAAFDLSIGNIAFNGTGGSFTVFATATGQAETVSGYTLKLNMTGSSSGELPVTFAEGPGAAAGFGVFDTNSNNVISLLNGTGVGLGGNTVGFTTFSSGVPFALASPTAVGTFSFTTANGFNPGDFIDVGFVFGSTADTTFSDGLAREIALTAVGGTNQPGNNPIVATSTRIAAVPEPSTFGFLGLAGAGLFVRRKRRSTNR
jgi:hypothetical protein